MTENKIESDWEEFRRTKMLPQCTELQIVQARLIFWSGAVSGAKDAWDRCEQVAHNHNRGPRSQWPAFAAGIGLSVAALMFIASAMGHDPGTAIACAVAIVMCVDFTRNRAR